MPIPALVSASIRYEHQAAPRQAGSKVHLRRLMYRSCSRLDQTSPAGLRDVHPRHFWAAVRRLHHLRKGTVRLPYAVTPYHAYKFFDVVAFHREHGQPCILVEPWLLEFVHRLGAMKQLMLNQRTELGVRAQPAIGRIQSDDEIWKRAKPLLHLQFLPGLLPLAAPESRLLCLPDDAAPLAAVLNVGPQEPDVRFLQV
jgi:hypothetical protein